MFDSFIAAKTKKAVSADLINTIKEPNKIPPIKVAGPANAPKANNMVIKDMSQTIKPSNVASETMTPVKNSLVFVSLSCRKNKLDEVGTYHDSFFDNFPRYASDVTE